MIIYLYCLLCCGLHAKSTAQSAAAMKIQYKSNGNVKARSPDKPDFGLLQF